MEIYGIAAIIGVSLNKEGIEKVRKKFRQMLACGICVSLLFENGVSAAGDDIWATGAIIETDGDYHL